MTLETGLVVSWPLLVHMSCSSVVTHVVKDKSSMALYVLVDIQVVKGTQLPIVLDITQEAMAPSQHDLKLLNF